MKPSRSDTTDRTFTGSALSHLASTVALGGFQAVHSPAGKDTGIEQLTVTLGQWDEDLLLMRFVSMFDLAFVSGQLNELEETTIGPELVHGTLIFPFEIPRDRRIETMRIISIVNRLLLNTTFIACEDGGSCLLQTCLSFEPGHSFPTVSANEQLMRAAHATERYAPIVRDVAAGGLNYYEARRNFEAGGLAFPEIPPQPRFRRGAWN